LNTPHLRFLRTVREHELDRALAYFPPARQGDVTRTVLEIGAGTGQQARSLSHKGYQVVAVDLPSSHYRNDRVVEITEYDGHNIPMPDQSIDVVFSSNVLEHVLDIDGFLDEQQRVMKEDGIAIHILPSTACRLWGIPAHYIWFIRRILALLTPGLKQVNPEFSDTRIPRKPQSARDWLSTFIPMPHGERGNTLSEAYYFSRHWWRRKFRQHGFTIVRVDGNGIFYTMANALTDSLSLKLRSRLAPLLGSACHIYVLKRDKV
jgi:SAM-dependent methyltransferase